MNKAMLVELLAKTSKESKATCKRILEAFISVIGDALKKNKSVALTGFGTFLTMKRKERVGVNPTTRKKIKIPAKRVPKFKAGKWLKSLVA